MQAMEAAVIRRRAEMAVLRSLGVAPSEIRNSWFREGMVTGLVGSLLGVLIGFGLAQGMVGAIGRTVNTLYYETTPSAIRLEFGVLAILVAVIVPARNAAITPPAQMLRQGTHGGGLLLLRERWLGLLLVITGWGSAMLPPWTTGNGSLIPA